jgi:hypothetical protein
MLFDSRLARVCRCVGLILIGLFSICSSLWFRNFAEIHIQFQSFNFPIFIGEWLFLACIILFIAQWDRKNTVLNRWYYCFLLYIGWLFLKILHGYLTAGPLALRHAVLFSYPLFAVLTYHFYDRKYFQNQIVLVCLLIGVIIFDRLMINRYFQIYYLALAAVLILHVRHGLLRNLLGLVVVCVFPWNQLFEGARGHVISVLAVAGYLTFCLIFVFLKGKRMLQIGFFCLIILLVVFGLKNFANKDKLKSLIAFQEIIQTNTDEENQFKEKIKTFKFKEISPKLYNPEKENLKNYILKDKSGNNFGEDFNAKYAQAQKDIASMIYDSMVPDEKQPPSLNETEVSSKKNENFSEKVNDSDMYTQINIIISTRFEILIKELGQLFKEANEEMKVKGSQYRNSILEKARIKFQQSFDRAVQEINVNLNTLYKENSSLSQDELADLIKKNNIIINNEFLDIHTEFDKYADALGKDRLKEVEVGNILFRIVIWRDMLDDMLEEKAILGVNLGKPQRSKRLEILGQAYGEWSRDGWITPHNSFFHMIYRAGIVGVLIVGMFFYSIVFFTRQFIKFKSLTGLILTSVIIYWTVIANTLVILEFPYYAIPVWSLFGMIFAYHRDLTKMPDPNVD